MGTINATCGLIHMKELKLQKLNYLKYREDGLYDSQDEKNKMKDKMIQCITYYFTLCVFYLQ
jgi:hypothetical protein